MLKVLVIIILVLVHGTAYSGDIYKEYGKERIVFIQKPSRCSFTYDFRGNRDDIQDIHIEVDDDVERPSSNLQSICSIKLAPINEDLKYHREDSMDYIYLTPGLNSEGSEPFGVLYCEKDLAAKESYKKDIECKYVPMLSVSDLYEFLPHYRKSVLYHSMGGVDFNGNLNVVDGAKKAIIVSYADIELSSIKGTEPKQLADKRFEINTLYSLLRAMKVRRELQSIAQSRGQQLSTKTYFFSDLFSSHDKSKADDERKTVIYYYSGDFSGQDFIDRAMQSMKNRITVETVDTIQKLVNSRHFANKKDTDQMYDALDILYKMAKADSIAPLEELGDGPCFIGYTAEDWHAQGDGGSDLSPN